MRNITASTSADRGGVEDENNHREPRTRSALISKFLVDQTFYDDSGTSFLDPGAFDSQRILGHHAMVLIGSRAEGDQAVFLMQNWWAGRYLIEVSASYLSRCGAVIADVESSLTSLPDGFPFIGELTAETVVDSSETFHDALPTSLATGSIPSSSVSSRRRGFHFSIRETTLLSFIL
jgi:hypothetical protein